MLFNSFLIGILSFLILRLTGCRRNIFGNVVGSSHRAFVQKVKQITLSGDEMPVFGPWEYPGIIVDFLVFEVDLGND